MINTPSLRAIPPARFVENNLTRQHYEWQLRWCPCSRDVRLRGDQRTPPDEAAATAWKPRVTRKGCRTGAAFL